MADIEATIVIAAFNAERTISDCVASAIAQADIVGEVVVADDHSSDDTARIAVHAGARVLRSARNGGPAAARNTAIDAARGDWLAVLDADDRMAPRRLRRMIDLARATEADMVLGNFQNVAPDGRVLSRPGPIQGDDARMVDLESYLAIDAALSQGQSLGYLKPVMRAAFVNKHGLRYPGNLRNGEDFHLVLACLVAGARVFLDPVPDYQYRTGVASVSHRIDLGHLGALIAEDDRFVSAHGAALSEEVRALFDRRRTALRQLLTSETVLRALKSGRVGVALGALSRDPSATAMILGKLAEAVRRRRTRDAGS